MEASRKMQTMVPMATFVKAEGMKTLLHNATFVTVTPVQLDPRNDEHYFVDIRFRFSTKAGRPYFSETECGVDGDVAPKKLTSELSYESTSVEASVASGQDPETVPEYRANPQSEAVYMPDAYWIARTKTLSSILEEEAREQAEEESRFVSNVSGVRGLIRAEQADGDDEEPDMDREFCFDSPAKQATITTNGPGDETTPAPIGFADLDPSKQPTLNQVLDHGPAHSSDGIPRKESDEQIDREQAASVSEKEPTSNSEVPSDRNLARSSSFKGPVATTHRSVSRESLGRTSEENATSGLRLASFDSAKAVEQPQKKSRDNYDDPELLLIQPNPIQPPRKLKKSVEGSSRGLIQPKPIRPSYNPPADFKDGEAQPLEDPHLQPVVREEVGATPSLGGVEDRTDRRVENDNTLARSLMRRTSNLARKIMRKISSNDNRAVHEASSERNGEPDNADRFARRRSWFGRGR